MESPWTTKKRWLYKIDTLHCDTDSLVFNLEKEEEALDQLGKQGWEVFQIEKEKDKDRYKNLEHSIHDYTLTIYSKRERG